MSRVLMALVLWVGIGAQAGELLRMKVGTFDATQWKVKASQWPLAFSDQKSMGREEVHIIQFKQAITREDRHQLENQGLRVLQYVPDDAYLVKGSLQNINLGNRIRAVVPFVPSMKLSPELMPLNKLTSNNFNRMVVRVLESENQDLVAQELDRLPQVKVVDVANRSILIEAPRGAIQDIVAMQEVQWIEPQKVMTLKVKKFDNVLPNAPISVMAADYSDLSGDEDGTRILKLPTAWGRGFRGASQIVAAADTGLDTGVVTTVHRDVGTINQGQVFGMFSKSWKDPMGHGTHVAGSVVGNGAESRGKILGAAPEAEMIPQGMWSDVYSNITPPTNVADLFTKALSQGARIHTDSWGSSVNEYDTSAVQVDEFIFNNPEMLILFAAGNDGGDNNKDGRIDEGSLGSPATAKNCISVGASENNISNGGIQAKLGQLNGPWGIEPIASDTLSNNPNGLAAFSSRGPAKDGRIKPDLVAPGTNILSLRSSVKGADPLWGAYNDLYTFSGGTSMSTPLVAGAAAVVREYLVYDRGIAKPSAALLKGVLLHTAFDMFPGQFGAVGKAKGQELLNRRPDVNQGYGRVDLEKATRLSKTKLIDEKAGIGTGQVAEYIARISGGGSSGLRVTLVYNDAPGLENAAKALVNDLDLKVTTPSGRVLTKNDRLNNIEMIEIDSIEQGEYKIEVIGQSVPQGVSGNQPYALIIGRGQGDEPVTIAGF